MKKILVSIIIIAVMCAAIGGGIHAYFSDTETAAGNTFTAGTLNLQVGSSDPCVEHISLSGMKPNTSGNAASWLATNIGTIDGTLDITLSTITNNENGVSEVEIAAGESPSNTIGELGQLLKVAFWMDTNKDGTWSSGDYYLSSGGTKVSWTSGTTLPSAAYDFLNNYASKAWTSVQTITSTADAGNFRVEYNFPNNSGGIPGNLADNRAQSDSCVFDIIFVLNQQ
jgi:predicted ribosomally synthesized peptide with SipW-like signal peptide